LAPERKDISEDEINMMIELNWASSSQEDYLGS